MNITEYVKANTDELYKILKELCLIPAPSHHEEKRAEYCKAWFDKNGLEGAYIDEALNVVFPYQAEGSDRLAVFEAHTDTVFPDTEPMPYVDDGEKIYCPGVGDDTASVAVLMLTAKYFVENKIQTDGVLFVCNSCEEGLGNLKGTRFIFESFKGRVEKFISFDSSRFNYSATRCVGSHRYEVEVLTEGGHSWSKFGNTNAIAELSKIVNEIYSIELPKKEGKKVTYNVGEISGGTSVNTIAQSARMLCEYRSDDLELLAYMKGEFERIFEEAKNEKVTVKATLVGDRPCAADFDRSKQEALMKIAADVILQTTGEEMNFGSSSTDCNIPLSLGIPAITVGVYIGNGSHTREEYIVKSSLVTGFEIGIKVLVKCAEIR
ncbi:MAG: M20/M25/M40 family metallo-hydrolase [Ruminococcaceae bacterium]|nr:M20/M25/M40 family metallo-hydrolase [Oscillospiraceae bacterium]